MTGHDSTFGEPYGVKEALPVRMTSATGRADLPTRLGSRVSDRST
ncbi:MAG TPA: hypothetical protein VFH48_20740 [Chloroflexota bacterium]|nr:hypothetical protein [Chloroflexota bacterium]